MIHCIPKLHACQITNGAASDATSCGATCDTKGYNYLLASCITDTQADTAKFLTYFRLEEGDTTASFATISGYKEAVDYTHATALRVAATENTYMLGMPLTGRKRYMRLVIQCAAATQLVCTFLQLFRADELPTSAAEANCELTYFG